MQDTINTNINYDYLLNWLNKKELFQETSILIDLFEKEKNNSFVIGFTGHFSAGKSTLINHLIGQDILPSSPIPTSANIVEITNGQQEVEYNFSNDLFATSTDIDLELVKKLSKNGTEVDSLKIKKHFPELLNTTYMDTPGIDSADDEEMNRTLSRVHIIDYFIYVMDYNHVQSEVNFKFLKQLQERKLPFVIVVNQIDKHKETEIPFDVYHQSLLQSCEEWQIEPERIFYTSLKESNNKLNEFDVLTEFINKHISDSSSIVQQNIKNEINYLISSSVEKLYTSEKDLLDEEKLQKLKDELSLVSNRLVEWNGFEEQLIKNWKTKITKDVKSAYLMTHEMRELARSFLESTKQSFKVGTLFTKKKTEEEKMERESAFLEALNKQIQVQLTWQFRDWLASEVGQHDVRNNEIQNKIQNLEIKLSSEDIKRVINTSAEVNGEYVLLYADQLHNEIEKITKNILYPLISEITREIHSLHENEINDLESNQQHLTEEIKRIESSQAHKKKVEQKKRQLTSEIFDNSNINVSEVYSQLKDKQNKREQLNLEEHIKDFDEREEEATTEQNQNIGEIQSLSIEKIVSSANTTLTEIKPYSFLDKFKKRIEQQVNKVSNMTYTVALFGAFSAGKSSFANAWIGEEILPVSPNPTTAAINKIAPPDEKHAHGEVLVRLKHSEDLKYQLNQLFSKLIEEEFTTLEEIFQFAKKNKKKWEANLSRTNSSFISAFVSGYEDMQSLLEKNITVNVSEFQKYVTQENRSCFVEEITVYYDCELTRQGITLVDTPGADSIHARHTNVAMHYVKNSDAIVYLNYFNHAFARADREFLLQLGRLKDTFPMNKMFFILNAADLASSYDELQMVESYLSKQLKAYGVTQPKVYPYSSKDLMEGNPTPEEFKTFHIEFESFIKNELKQIIVQELEQSLKQLKQYIKQSLEEIKQGESEQKKIIEQYKNEAQQIIQHAKNVDQKTYTTQISNEADQLTYYGNQRVQIQLRDLMKESINPATIQSNGKKGQEELRMAIKELLATLHERLNKEFQEINILLDYHLEKSISNMEKFINDFIRDNTNFTNFSFPIGEIQQASYSNSITVMNQEQISMYAKMFKNKKDFFQDRKVKELFNQIDSDLKPSIQKVFQDFNSVYDNHYKEKFNEIQNEFLEELSNELEDIISSKLSFYENEKLHLQLEDTYRKLIEL
ncbi:dynamin family protein [Halalkalibacillus halophilus]|uniref:dynamin family protein n=1 Tax=Halalkalibacillus halophilus TaxID=392827 RepID=UPI000406E5C1|nr:dynamin family protein [Halalkalibacillus halophilus]